MSVSGEKVSFTNLNQGYDDCKELYDYVRQTGESELRNLNQLVESLKNAWKSKDATLRINELIMQCKLLHSFLDATIASLAIASEGIVATQQTLHIGDSTQRVDSQLGRISLNFVAPAEAMPTVGVEVDPEAQLAAFKTFTTEKQNFEDFTQNVKNKSDKLMGNWHSGANHSTVMRNIEDFKLQAGKIKDTLETMNSNFTTINTGFQQL